MVPDATKEAYFRDRILRANDDVSIHPIQRGGTVAGTAIYYTIVRASYDAKKQGYDAVLRDGRGSLEDWVLYPHKGV